MPRRLGGACGDDDRVEGLTGRGGTPGPTVPVQPSDGGRHELHPGLSQPLRQSIDQGAQTLAGSQEGRTGRRTGRHAPEAQQEAP